MHNALVSAGRRILYHGIFAVLILLAAFGGTAYINKPDGEKRLAVIMYHHILRDGSRAGDYVISPEQFENDMRHIAESGWETVSAEAVRNYVLGDGDIPDKSVMITFDDGFQSVYYYALPIAEKYSVPFTVSVIGSLTEEYTAASENLTEKQRISFGYLTREQIRMLGECGLCTIGNHTYDMHKNASGGRRGVSALPGESEYEHITAVKGDILRTQTLCRDAVGYEPFVFAYPFGICDKGSAKAVESAGFDITLGCASGTNILRRGDYDCLKNMKRWNRRSGDESDVFFTKILK